MARYSKVYMLFFVVAVAGLFQNNTAIAQSALIFNGGGYNAQCLLVNFPNDNVGYNKFVIPPNQYQKVDIGTKVRCSIDIDPGKSSTWLNYFVTDKKGVYTLMMQSVPYGQVTRYATVVTFDQAKRIKYTIWNKTPYPIDLLFLPNKNTHKLAPGKQTPCNSPIRDGAFPAVQATIPGIQPAAIWITKHGGNYYIVPVGNRAITIVLGKN